MFYLFSIFKGFSDAMQGKSRRGNGKWKTNLLLDTWGKKITQNKAHSEVLKKPFFVMSIDTNAHSRAGLIRLL